MKKYAPLLMKCAISLTILLGLLLILFTNTQGFHKIATDDIENISKLSSSIIYAEIDNSLTKPIFVGQTMANDLFLKNWLRSEDPKGETQAQATLIRQFLMGYRVKYGYDSVFLVSAKSGIYYYHDGVNKVVSPQNAHDVWYYDFIQSGKIYDLDVDMDEVNEGQLTVFINCRITDEDDNLMGVAGVGIRMSHLQALLKSYEDAYDLRAFLINSDGLVQIDTIADNIESTNFFARSDVLPFKERILQNKTSLENFWYPSGGTEHCMITKYVENLDWTIVVEKSTAQAKEMLSAQIRWDLLLVTLIICLVLFMISYMFSKYNRMLLLAAATDHVTGLPNNKLFQELYLRKAKRSSCRQGLVFLFDVDDFKTINDRHGHMAGNEVLSRVSAIAKECLGSRGVIARWGGDEFVGVFYGREAEGRRLLCDLVRRVAAVRDVPGGSVSVSLGATAIDRSQNLDALLHEADTAMYRAKTSGKNKTSFFR